MMDDETEAGASPRATPKNAAEPKGAAEPKNAAGQRAERLKAALRDNLRRRKVQLRGRADPAKPGETPDDTSETGETPEPGGEA